MTGIRETKIPAVDMSMKESLAFSCSEITQAGKRTVLSGILVELDKLGTPEPSSDAILNLTDEEKAELESDIAEVTSNPANWEQRIANKASAYKKHPVLVFVLIHIVPVNVFDGYDTTI